MDRTTRYSTSTLLTLLYWVFYVLYRPWAWHWHVLLHHSLCKRKTEVPRTNTRYSFSWSSSLRISQRCSLAFVFGSLTKTTSWNGQTLPRDLLKRDSLDNQTVLSCLDSWRSSLYVLSRIQSWQIHWWKLGTLFCSFKDDTEKQLSNYSCWSSAPPLVLLITQTTALLLCFR